MWGPAPKDRRLIAGDQEDRRQQERIPGSARARAPSCPNRYGSPAHAPGEFPVGFAVAEEEAVFQPGLPPPARRQPHGDGHEQHQREQLTARDFIGVECLKRVSGKLCLELDFGR